MEKKYKYASRLTSLHSDVMPLHAEIDIIVCIARKSFFGRASVPMFASVAIRTLQTCNQELSQQVNTCLVAEMSAEYEGKDPLELAKQAERDLNSHEAKTGSARAGASDSSKSCSIVRNPRYANSAARGFYRP